MISTDELQGLPPAARAEILSLRGAKAGLEIDKRILELKVQKYERMLWAKKSERLTPADQKQGTLFNDPAGVAPAPVPPAPKLSASVRGPRLPKGPKPLDPALPREVIAVPSPALKELICPETRQPMRPGFVETLEVLARRAPEYYVKRYERTVFVSPAKTAPVYAPWPAEVLPRSRMHVSIVAHLASAHYCEHQPFHRIEQDLARKGVHLPRNSQVSLMQQLDRMMEPLLSTLKQEVFASGYIHLDPTPVDLCDPARPGSTREATLWAYRAKNGAVWFDYQTSKSPSHADALLKKLNYRGYGQTDGATGLDAIGPPGQVTNLGCWTHARRRFYDAHQEGDSRAQWYLAQIGKLFRVDRIATRYGRKARLRERFSVPIFDQVMNQAIAHAEVTEAKTTLGDAVRYLLGQEERLARCLMHIAAELSNNPVERAIRPLKVGAKNWLFIGHPSAGPRLANLFTLVENCRLLAIDPERYLTDVMTRLSDHPAARIAELLPHRWSVSG
ncbi:MAG: family transposase [Verrucomicrobia bacterium]|nr:family transposase [Verrucomicrobiota bacterium]